MRSIRMLNDPEKSEVSAVALTAYARRSNWLIASGTELTAIATKFYFASDRRILHCVMATLDSPDLTVYPPYRFGPGAKT
jgi:hypothetical protein